MTDLTIPEDRGGTGRTYGDGTGTYGMASNNGYGYTTLFFPMLSEVMAACQSFLDEIEGNNSAAEDWATKTSDTVDGIEYSAKEYAQGTQVGAGGSSKRWANYTAAAVSGGEFSAKEYAQGSQAATGGSAQNWSQQVGTDVTGAAALSRSAKSWAQEQLVGGTYGGSAKDWASYVAGTVDGTNYSAKYHATLASASQVAAAASATLVAGYVSTVQGYLNQAAAYAAAAAAAQQQDLSGVVAGAGYRSPNAIVAILRFKPWEDSDGGAWLKQCADTSWANEALNGVWLGWCANEAAARAVSGATTGDYFGRTSDGKCYKLDSGSGITEVFRGNKALPSDPVAIAEGGRITIIDIAETGFPMWMVFVNTATTSALGANSTGVISSIDYEQGKLVVGTNQGGLIVDFAKDDMMPFRSGATRLVKRKIAFRNAQPVGAQSTAVSGVDYYQTSHSTTNFVGMCTMPDAPADPATGLQVPTILLLTSQSANIIQHDGTVRTSSSTAAYVAGSITPYAIWAAPSGAVADFALKPGALGASFAMTRLNAGVAPGFTVAASTVASLTPIGRSTIGYRSGARVSLMRMNEVAVAASLGAQIADTYSTGWWCGDIRRAWDFGVTAGTAGATVADRSYKNKPLTTAGTVTLTAVASGAQIVAGSGWSASNYLQEAYSADLDMGTGAWSASYVGSLPVTTGSSAPAAGGVGPAVNYLPLGNFPVIATIPANLNTAEWTKGTGWAGTGGGTFTLDGSAGATQTQLQWTSGGNTPTAGRVRKWTLTISALALNGGTLSVFPNSGAVFVIAATGTYTGIGDSALGLLRASGGTGVTCSGSIVVEELGDALAVDRSAATGAFFNAGVNALGYLMASVGDGTTPRTVRATASYITGQYIKASAVYTTDGTLALNVNGKQVATAPGTPLLTLNNASAVLTVGNSRALDAPFPGSIAMVKVGATAPTFEQSAWMWEQEKEMFRSGALVTLPDSGALVDLAYDPETDTLRTASAANDAAFTGMVRTSSAAAAAGSISKIAGSDGIKMVARITTTPGVDITIPAQNLREELARKAADEIARRARPAQMRVYRATSGQTSFPLSVGDELVKLFVAGSLKTEGGSDDYTVGFDGFKPTVTYPAGAALNAVVQAEVRRAG